MLQIIFAFLGGVLTVAAPCILPILPILLGSSVGQKNKLRPLFIVLGFITTFALVSLILAVAVQYVPFLNQNTIRSIAIVLIGIFGIFLIWPLPFELLMARLSPLMNRAGQTNGDGNMGALLLGMSLGLVWAPCAGPILATILALIAVNGPTLHSAALLLSYSLGAGIPMLIIAYGSQYVTRRVHAFSQYTQRLQQIFGVLIVLLAIAMYFQYDTKIITKLTEHFPGLTKLESAISLNKEEKKTMVKNTSKQLENYGTAPEFTGIQNWINSEPLTMASLKGKVVLLDFWTYSCINCIRTLPHVTKWYETYKNKGFVVVGVHTPEFAFEKVTENVQTAMKRFGINYPVAQDNNFATWTAYKNKYWPAHYLIDKEGTIRYTHFGEGNYEETEAAIQELLDVDMEISNVQAMAPAGAVRSPEMYFGTSRLEFLTRSQSPNLGSFSFPETISLNTFALEGKWQFSSEQITSLGKGKIRLKFSSGKVFMVAASKNATMLKITVDGKPQADVIVKDSQLYPLFDSGEYKEHVIDIEIPAEGLEAFTFTFG